MDITLKMLLLILDMVELEIDRIAVSYWGIQAF